MTMFTINDPTNEITDAQGNVGLFQDGDPVFAAYLAWTAADPENHVAEHTFNYPPPPPEPLTKLAFMNRFTMDEKAAIYTAAKQNVYIEIWLDQFKLAEYVDVSDPRTIAGINALESFGLIGAGRAAELLAG